MDLKFDINDVIKKAIGVTTTFGKFWEGITFPNNLGPALSYLIVLGILPFAGNLLQGIIPTPVFGVWVSRGITWGIISAIMAYVFFVGMPIAMGYILAAVDKAMNVDKGDANKYATAMAYASTPAAIGGFLAFVPFLGWLLSLALAIVSIIVTYLAFTVGLKLESGQAIIMMVIMIVVWVIIYAILFTVVIGAFAGSTYSMGGGFGGY